MDTRKNWKYKNTTLLAISIFLAYLIFQSDTVHTILLNIGSLGYLGAFIAGILFVSTFTIATGVTLLLIFSELIPAWQIGIIAGIGAVVGDFLIFRLVKNNLLLEITEIYNGLGGKHITHLLKTKYFGWFFPVFGAIIIASPLPDELGVSLLGISKMKTYQFLILSFVLNATGIFLTISASTIIKP